MLWSWMKKRQKEQKFSLQQGKIEEGGMNGLATGIAKDNGIRGKAG